MARETLTLPLLSESMAEATIGKWLKKPGDSFEPYDVLCELITEKVTAEMPATYAGVMAEIIAPEGSTVPVGGALCVVARDGVDNEVEDPNTSNEQVSEHIGNLDKSSTTSGEGANRTVIEGRFSPVVLRLLQENRLDPAQIKGSGFEGRVTRKDVLDHIANTPKRQTIVMETPAESANQQIRHSGLHLSEQPAIKKVQMDSPPPRDPDSYEIEVTPVRNTIASKMRQSVSEIPHAWTMIEVDVTPLVALRNQFRDEFQRKEGINLTYLPFLIQAVVNAIKDYPIMNSHWAVDKIVVKRAINIALAVGTEDSVLTPVIKNADQKNILGIAREIDGLVNKARAGKLTLSDMTSGTFTINNTGSFGSILSYPIINYPQAAILTFESIVKKPVVIDDMIAVRSMVNLCLSLDHRILDGVICGRFLQRVKENLQSYDRNTKLY